MQSGVGIDFGQNKIIWFLSASSTEARLQPAWVSEEKALTSSSGIPSYDPPLGATQPEMTGAP